MPRRAKRSFISSGNGFYVPFDEQGCESRKPDSYRSRFQIDRDRIIHSYAFRRLQAKTQVFRPGEYDFYRTRLTHTIEVSQIGRSICNFLKKKSRYLNGDFYIDPDLIEAVCLAHDIGHAPFGHAGERALNALMSDFGGFEGNAQTLRLLTETIWAGSSPGQRMGLNPPRALLDGILKYKKTHSVAKSTNHFIYDEQQKYVDFIYDGATYNDQQFHSIECQIMDWADDVAYSVADLVDGVRARFITIGKLGKWKSDKRNEPLVNELIKNLEDRTLTRFAANKIGEFVEVCKLEKSNRREPLAGKTNRYRYELAIETSKRSEQQCLKQISFDLVFASPAVQQLEYKARRMVEELFQIMSMNYLCAGAPKQHLLNEDTERMFEKAASLRDRARLLCDHISGMSDDYVIRTYRRLLEPEFGSIVDLV
jgi:dGTPase